MKHRIQFTWIVLVMLMTIIATHGTAVQTFYDMLEPGDSVLGRIGASFTTGSNIQCSNRYSTDNECKWYKYEGPGAKKCVLIYRAKTVDVQRFISSEQSVIYNKKCDAVLIGIWIAPCGWNGPAPVFYNSFDTLNGLVLMEATEHTNFNAMIVGKVNGAISLNHTRSQWVDLGNLAQACIIYPGTCDVAGGSIAFWMRLNHYDTKQRGIISSSKEDFSISYFRMFFRTNTLHVIASTLDRNFGISVIPPSGWTHVVLNYIGPNSGQGMRIYYDGVQTGSVETTNPSTYQPGEGRVVLGREFIDEDDRYISVNIDELLFFNETLTDQNIQDLS